MTREDIIRLAKEAGFLGVIIASPEELERFAEFAAAEEREACVRVCEEIGGPEALDCAAAISARGESK